jgi:osmotically-inducible protein OsmY
MERPLAALLLGAWVLASASAAVPAAPTDSSPAVSAGTDQSDTASSDEAVKARVEKALQSAKYSLETHVTVTVNKDEVMLGGFVWSDWDRRHALKIAARAAGGRRIVDSMELKTGEMR